LELVLDPDGLDESHLRGRVEPVQRVAGVASFGGIDSEVERRVVERALVEALRHAVPVVVYGEDLSIVGEVDTAEVFTATGVYRATIDAISYEDERFSVDVTLESSATRRIQARTFVVDVVNDELVWK
jgi:hypothetical protein